MTLRRVTVAVTTSKDPDGPTEARATFAARLYGVPFVPRGRRSIAELIEGVADAIVVLGRDEVHLCDAHGTTVWSAGMAALRIKTIERGAGDALVEVGELKPGDHLLDCTLGFGQDALVASRAVGKSGRVFALEKSPVLSLFTGEGLALAGPVPGGCPVETAHADAAVQLGRQVAKSFDVVVFDPMFSRPRKANPAFEAVRRWADPGGLTAELISAARRVARRFVIVKGSRYSEDLVLLGVAPLERSRYSEVVWGRVPGA